jgi:hypothetical protein
VLFYCCFQGGWSLFDCFIAIVLPGWDGKMRWGGWCNFGYKNRLVIRGWRAEVPAPGPGFRIKGTGALRTHQLEAIVETIDWKRNPFLNKDLTPLSVERWSAGNTALCTSC